MRGWVQTVAACLWVGFAPVAVQTSQAGQLPEDVHRTSRSRLPPIDREALDPTRREAYDAAMRAAGSGGAPTGAAALRLHGSGTDLRFSGPLGRRLTELAILTTAREHDQPYEWALHELDALAVGLDELLIDVVRHRKPITSVGDPEAIVMEVGRELFATRRLGSDTYARALARLGRTNLVDLIDLMGRYASTAATLTAFNQQMPLGWRQSLPLPVWVQTIVDHVRPRNKRDFAARGGGPHEQGEVSRESGARHPAEDAAPVLSRRKDPDRSRGAARRREHSDALSPRGPEPESLLPVEQGVPRSREETACWGYDPRSDVE